MLLLKPHHLAIISAAANQLPMEKQPTFVDRVRARLRLRDVHLTDADLADAIKRALRGLMAPRRFPPPWSVEA